MRMVLCIVFTVAIFVAAGLLHLFDLNSKLSHSCDNCKIISQKDNLKLVSPALHVHQTQSTTSYDYTNTTTVTVTTNSLHDTTMNREVIKPTDAAKRRSNQLFHVREYSKIRAACNSECINSKGPSPIPKQIFFIKTDTKWQYTEWIAVLSVHRFVKPDIIYIVSRTAIELSCWWNRTLSIPAVSHVTPDGSKWVTEIRGRKFTEPAHVCDFMKTTVLYEMGGILMDTDAFAVKTFNPLLNHQAVLARDQGGFVVNGLMISQKHSCFMCNFAKNSFLRYNGNWNTHSTWTLNPVWRNYKDVLILKQYDGFFPFSPNEIRLQNFLIKDKADLPDDVSRLYAVHLYHNLLNKNEIFRKIKEKSIDSFAWLKESRSFGAEVFRSILPSNFTKDHFDTSKACIPITL